MKRVGVIGVGEIGRAVVTGLCEGEGSSDDRSDDRSDVRSDDRSDVRPDDRSDVKSPAVFLSPRGARITAELAARYADVAVCADNQEVVDRSEVVMIAVRRQDRHEALAGLRVGGDKVVVNVMAGVGNDDLRRTLATDAPLVRAIPLPAVRERRSVTVTYPSHPAVNSLFEDLGGVLPAADEAAFNVFSALTGTLTTHYWYLATLTSWAVAHGIPSDEADGYVRSLFQGVGRALSDGTRTLHQLAADHETPNGSNERIRTTWFDGANGGALNQALDDLLADLN
ncbi:NAD(P)-binding domain-containing protein [Streptomyces pseudovenezuelae]|uniref:Pyrroline-5-carboxylate reductase n=1 Tax=Streptomyces pseudovenezuelae TaxID=67350 RepID=A0ABT6LNC3_9ACTN|nr:NAD(P)-binding domain-containing protein [Streptomyces pseudovenezuelae]MDH6217818.1 pyrroline-5-carboxylate reductase [Streptomyces pseudovenezuelae]